MSTCQLSYQSMCKCRLVTQSGTHFKPAHSQGSDHTFQFSGRSFQHSISEKSSPQRPGHKCHSRAEGAFSPVSSLQHKFHPIRTDQFSPNQPAAINSRQRVPVHQCVNMQNSNNILKELQEIEEACRQARQRLLERTTASGMQFFEYNRKRCRVYSLIIIIQQ